MNNCGFRNAVIGKNEVAEPIWPFLNESNKILKRRSKSAVGIVFKVFFSYTTRFSTYYAVLGHLYCKSFGPSCRESFGRA